MRTHSLYPLNVGTLTLGKDHLFGNRFDADDRVPFALYSFLIRSEEGQSILVDLGPKSLAYTNAMFRRYNFFRETDGEVKNPDDIRQPEGNIFDNLAAQDLSPDDIDHIIFTHLHADHHGMDDAQSGGAVEDFPNAVFHISKMGWDFNLRHRQDDHWNSYLDWGFGDAILALQKQDRVVLDDDADVVDGVSTIFLGGHSVCSQAVRVETTAGPAIITSDDIYCYHLLQSGQMSMIHTTEENLLKAVDRLVHLALEEKAILLPVHDPVIMQIYDEHGEQWLQKARELTVEAAESYHRKRQAGRVVFPGSMQSA